MEKPLSCQHVQIFVGDKDHETYIWCQSSVLNFGLVNKKKIGKRNNTIKE